MNYRNQTYQSQKLDMEKEIEKLRGIITDLQHANRKLVDENGDLREIIYRLERSE